MRQAYGPDRIAQSYTDKVMSFRMEEDKDKIVRETARKFEEIVKQFRVQHGLEVSHG